MHERNHELLDIKIKQYLLPAIMMKLALQLGNVVDTMLVGNLLGTDAMSAVSLSIPVLSLIQIPGFFLGNGGAIAAGILLGRRQKKEAREVFSTTLIITVFCGILFFISSFFATKPLAHLLSHGGSLEADVASYVFVCLAGAPILGLGLLLSSYFAGDSHPQLASAYFIIANAVNLFFDYIFLKYTPLGVTGAALSTMVGFAVALIVLILYIRSPKRMLAFTKPHLTLEMMKSIGKTGMPYLTYLLASMFKMLLMNSIVLKLLGETGMAVYTVCNNTALILMMFIGGVMGVMPNIAGILYGEKDFYGIHVLYKKIISYGLILTGILMAVVFVFTPGFTLLFGVTEQALKEIMVAVLRVYVFSMPFNMWNYFGMQYYGSVEKPALSTLITTLENGVFLIPVAFAGIIVGQRTGGSGYMGLAAAFVISESLTALVSFIYRKVKYPGGSVLLIPDKNPGICLDFTIRADKEEVPSVPRELRAFCSKNSVDSSRANLIAVCAEEMVMNIVAYGGEKSKWIDICLTVNDKAEEPHDGGAEEAGASENAGETAAEDREELMLRLRDNGVPFDPTTYEFDDQDFDIHGIELAMKTAKSISYIRAIDLNNTTVTV